MKFIYNYILAKRVCKKYGITFVPVWSFDMWKGKYNYNGGAPKLWCSVFAKEFEAVFFHELGHHRDISKNWKYIYYWYCNKFITNTAVSFKSWGSYSNYYRLLLQEAKASRFANRVMKGKDQDILIKAFRTYSRTGFKQVKSEFLFEMTDYCVKMEKLITD